MTRSEIKEALQKQQFLVHDINTVMKYMPEETNIDRETFVSLLEQSQFPIHEVTTISIAVFG